MVHRPTILERNFDSVLHPARPNQPARLNIRLKVKLVASDPESPFTAGTGVLSFSEHLARHETEVKTGTVQDADGRSWRRRSWWAAEFNAFCIEFKKVVERWWNNQLILLPPDGSQPGEEISDATFKEFVSASHIPAHVRCGLEIALEPFGVIGTPHVIIDMVRLERPANHQFRSHAMRMTNEDVEVSRAADSTGHIHTQVTAAHEIGHWLGRPFPMTDPGRFLDHVDLERCMAADPHYQRGDDCEYGRTLSNRMAMMGSGSLLTKYEAKPWLIRVRRHTWVLFGWDIIHRDDFDRRMIVPVSERQKRLGGAATVSRH